MADVSQSGSSTSAFMQLIPAYEVAWALPDQQFCRLIVAQDDLQAVIRAVLRTDPRHHIRIDQVDMQAGQREEMGG